MALKSWFSKYESTKRDPTVVATATNASGPIVLIRAIRRLSHMALVPLEGSEVLKFLKEVGMGSGVRSQVGRQHRLLCRVPPIVCAPRKT